MLPFKPRNGQMTTRPLPVLLLLLAACATNVHKEGPTVGEDPNLLGVNITDEIQAGEFFIGPGDQVILEVWNHMDLNKTYVVDSEGRLKVHLVKAPLEVGGLTRDQLRTLLEQEYARYLVDPSLDVTISYSPDRKVTMLGQLGRPGTYPLTNPRTTVLDMLANAGGVGADGDTTGILMARELDGQVQVRSYNLDLLFDPDDPNLKTQIPFVQPGDIVYVLRTWQSEFDEDLRTVSDMLRTINFAERALILAPRTGSAVRGDGG